jgi:hypothetical protein
VDLLACNAGISKAATIKGYTMEAFVMDVSRLE